jgi:hypothetical protein
MDDEADALYALPLEQFVSERAMLAKALRAEGDRDTAAEVAKLPKPSLAAWAVNQVVRTQPALAKALWEAGDAVLDAQARAVAGKGGGPELRDALKRERAALEPLGDAARGLVTGRGAFLGEPNVQAVIETLHAAAVDPSARPEVAAGRTARPLKLSGLEALAGVSAADSRAATHRTRIAEREREDAGIEQDRKAAAAAERKRRTELQRALTRAERDRDAARARVTEIAREREQHATRIGELREELDRAEADLARAEDDRRAAHQALERAEDAVASVRDDLDAL